MVDARPSPPAATWAEEARCVASPIKTRTFACNVTIDFRIRSRAVQDNPLGDPVAIIGLIVLLALAVVALTNAPADWRGTKPIVSSYSVVVVAIILFVVIPSIPLLVRGSYIWAPGYFSEDNVSNAIWLTVLALMMFLLGNMAYRKYELGAQRVSEGTSYGEIEPTVRPDTRLLLFSLLGFGIALKLFLVVFFFNL